MEQVKTDWLRKNYVLIKDAKAAPGEMQKEFECKRIRVKVSFWERCATWFFETPVGKGCFRVSLLVG